MGVPFGFFPAHAQEHAFAARELVLSDLSDTYVLGDEVEELEDPGGALSIRDVSSGPASAQFSGHSSESFNMGLRESVTWFRFRLHNGSQSNVEWILEASNPRLNRVSLYILRKDLSIRQWHSGNAIPYSEWPVDFRHPSFHFRLRQDSEAMCYLRVENRGASRFNLVLYSEQAFNRHALRIEIAWGVFYGAIISMMLYNAVLMLALRDRTYFYYFLLILAFFLYQTTMNGTAFQWFWPTSTWWADHSIIFFFGITFFFGILFSRSFLDLHTHYPLLDKTASAMMIVCIAISLGSLGSHIVANTIAHAVALVGPPAILAIAARRWISGYTPARVMVVAWGTLTSGALVTVFASFGALPQTLATEYTVPLGFTLALLLFALALADRIRMVEREYQEMLSQTVEERTRELNVAREDIKTLSELMPICSSCKKIRDDKGYWNQLESYLSMHADLEFSHSICPECAKRLYPEHYRDLEPGATE